MRRHKKSAFHGAFRGKVFAAPILFRTAAEKRMES
jgi:hypothetical protein